MKPYNEEESKKEQVEQMFDNIAPTYDRLNHILSFNIDRMWRRRVMRIVRRSKAQHVLDIATGTGDLAIAMTKSIDNITVLGVDLSEEMLRVAEQKVQRLGLEQRIKLQKGDAENLQMIADASVDVVTVAFGVRNFENLERGLGELCRVLKPGGKVVVLEFSIPRCWLVRWVYAQYSHRLLPRIGAWLSKDRKAYDYLPDSVEEFASPERFIEMLHGVGFTDARAKSQSFGIAHIYQATK